MLLDLLSCDITNKPIHSLPTKSSTKKKQKIDFRDHQQAIVQWILRKELSGRESGATRAIFNEWLQWKKHYFNNTGDVPEPGLLYGDWEALLDKLCEGNFNLADSLFTSFENGLKPTLSHRYLSYLQPKLGIPLLLTTNFDSFIEQAFQKEGIPPKVFDVHRDAELPNSALVRKQFSFMSVPIFSPTQELIAL